MSKEDIKAFPTKSPIDQTQNPVTFGVAACWLLAAAVGVALWALLFNVAPAIVGLISRH